MVRNGPFDILWRGYPFLHRQIFHLRQCQNFLLLWQCQKKLDKARKQFFHLHGQNFLSQLLGQIFFLNFQGEFLLTFPVKKMSFSSGRPKVFLFSVKFLLHAGPKNVFLNFQGKIFFFHSMARINVYLFRASFFFKRGWSLPLL